MSGILFSDTFDVVGIDIEPATGKKDKKFDKGEYCGKLLIL